MRKLSKLHLYDCLRANKSLAAWGVEGRVPFLDKEFLDVAMRMNAHFVDANRITHDLEQSLGVEGSKKLHMWYKPGEHPALPQGRQDNTHYNIYGAHVVAGLLSDALVKEIPVLGKYHIEK